jgi:hypothetical protein
VSTSASLREALRHRPWVVAAGLLVLCLAAGRFTAFRTLVRLKSEGGVLSLTVNGRTVRGQSPAGTVRGIRIETINSVFPMGGETLTLSQGDRVLVRDRLPRRFSVPTNRYAPLGDWSLDPWAGSATVYERRVLATGDFVLEATFTGRCVEYTSIFLVGEPDIRAQFRRGLMNNDFVLGVGGRNVGVDALYSPLPQMAWEAGDLVLRGVIAVIRAVLSRRRRLPGEASLRRVWLLLKPHWPALAAGAVALVALFIRGWTAHRVLEGLAHTPDEVAYILQAKWIVADRIYQAISPIQEYLSVPFTYVRDGKWFSMYPIGWPLVLSLGELVGLPWMVSPVCGALYVFVLYLIGKELHGELVGLGAAVLGAFSPMAILMSASFLSHAAAALAIAVFLWLHLVDRRRRSPWIAGMSGLALGFAFAIRPVTALAIAVPFALVLLRDLWKTDDRPDLLRRYAAFVLCGLAGSAPVFISNHMISGRALSFAYGFGAHAAFSWESLPFGLLYLDATAASVLPAAFGWGWGTLSGWVVLSLTLAFACVAFVLGRARRYDWLLAVFLVTLPLSFVTWGFHGLHGYGPRLYFEAFLGLYLLTSFGFFLLAGIDATRRPVRFERGKAVAVLAVGLFALLTLTTVRTLRTRLELYAGYNGVDGGLEKAIGRERLQKALVLLRDDDWFSWGAASRLLSADLRPDLAFAAFHPDNRKVISYYGDRPVYVWYATRLIPSEPSPPSPSPPIPESPENPAHAATLLGWWFGLFGAVAAVTALLARESRASASRPPVARPPSRPVERLPPDPYDTFARPEGRVAPKRPAAAVAGVATAYLGQMLLTPLPISKKLPLSALSERQLFHGGWILLVLGAVLFAAAWASPDAGESASSGEPRS